MIRYRIALLFACFVFLVHSSFAMAQETSTDNQNARILIEDDGDEASDDASDEGVEQADDEEVHLPRPHGGRQVLVAEVVDADVGIAEHPGEIVLRHVDHLTDVGELHEKQHDERQSHHYCYDPNRSLLHGSKVTV